MKRSIMGVVGAFLLAGMAFAADDAADLGKIIVTSYRYEEAVGKTAAAVSVITPADIRNSGAANVIGVLSSVPGLITRDLYGNGTKADVDMGGFGEQAALNVLVLIDGRRANDVDLNGVDWGQIPLDQVKSIEIIHGGSGAVLYGDNAASGVINIITKRGGGASRVTGETRYGSYDQNSQNVSVAGGIQDKASFWLGVGRDSTNGYRQNSFSKTNNFAGRFNAEVTDRVSVHADAGLNESTYGIPGALYQDNIDQYGRTYARFVQDHANDKDYYSLIGAEADFVEAGKFALDFSYRRKATDSYFLSSGNPTRRNDINTFGLTPKYTLSHGIFGRDNKLIAGVDFYETLFNSTDYRKTTNARLDYTNIRRTSLAGYVQDELALTDNLTFVNGARTEQSRYAFNYHDDTAYSPDQDTRTRPKEFAWNSGLVHTYAKDSNVFLNTSQSYRFPEVDEFTFTDENWMQQLKTSIHPQTSINYEGGVRHAFSDDVKAGISLFRMNVHNELFYNSTYAYLFDPWSGWYWSGQNDNYKRTIHQGMQASLDARLNERITSFGNYTYTDAVFDGGVYSGHEIPMVPKHKASAGVRVSLSQEVDWSLSGTYVGSRRFYNDQANSYSRLNGYAVADTLLSWHHKDVTITAGINNLFNRKYAQYAGVRVTEDGVYGYHVGDKFYFPSPERNFSLGVKYSF